MLIDALTISDREALERFRANTYDTDVHDELRRLRDAATALRGLLDAERDRAAKMATPISAELLIVAGFQPMPHPRTGIVNAWSLDVGACHVLVSMPSPGLDEWGVSLVQISDDALSFTRRHWGDVVRLIEALKGGGECRPVG